MKAKKPKQNQSTKKTCVHTQCEQASVLWVRVRVGVRMRVREKVEGKGW